MGVTTGRFILYITYWAVNLVILLTDVDLTSITYVSGFIEKAYLATPVRISMRTYGLKIYRLPNDSVGSFISLAMASPTRAGLSRILINWQGCARKLGSFGLLGSKKHTSCALNSQLLREASSTPQGFRLYLYLRVHDTCHSVLVCLASIWQLAQDGGER